MIFSVMDDEKYDVELEKYLILLISVLPWLTGISIFMIK